MYCLFRRWPWCFCSFLFLDRTSRLVFVFFGDPLIVVVYTFVVVAIVWRGEATTARRATAAFDLWFCVRGAARAAPGQPRPIQAPPGDLRQPQTTRAIPGIPRPPLPPRPRRCMLTRSGRTEGFPRCTRVTPSRLKPLKFWALGCVHWLYVNCDLFSFPFLVVANRQKAPRPPDDARVYIFSERSCRSPVY